MPRRPPPEPDSPTTERRIDPAKVLEDLDLTHPNERERDSALTDVLSPGGRREDVDRDRSGFVKPHRFQHT